MCFVIRIYEVDFFKICFELSEYLMKIYKIPEGKNLRGDAIFCSNSKYNISITEIKTKACIYHETYSSLKVWKQILKNVVYFIFRNTTFITPLTT